MLALLRVVGVVLIGLAGCSPSFDWREVRPQGSGAVVLFPCKPGSHARGVVLGAGHADMFMYACETAGTTFALSYVDVRDPAQLGPSLAAQRAALVDTLHASVETDVELVLPGMTPSPQARRLQLAGRLPSGGPAKVAAALFARGTHVFQATVVGPRLDTNAVDTFFAGVAFPP